MRTEVVVNLPEGLHARPAAKIAELIQATQVQCLLYLDSGVSAKLNSTLELISLGVRPGQRVMLEYPEQVAAEIGQVIQILESQ